MAAVGVAQEKAGDTSTPVPEPAGKVAQEKAPAEAKKAKKAPPKSYLLRQVLHAGTTFVGSNTVAFDVKTTKTRDGKVTKSREAVERTERFRDRVETASDRGPFKIERTYQKLFTKVRVSGKQRPDVDQSPLQGRKVTITERGRTRRVKCTEGLVVPPIVRKSVGVELDWRDILPREAVKVGDKWEADAERLARRIAVYLDSGTRSEMKVTFEGIDERGGRRCAKFYVDWKLDGMRNRQLFTQARLAGDVLFDLDLKRFVSVDLSGEFGIQGAIMGNGSHEIVKGEGSVVYKSTLREVPIVAAATGE
jgi:hypothetical protein